MSLILLNSQLLTKQLKSVPHLEADVQKNYLYANIISLTQQFIRFNNLL